MSNHDDGLQDKSRLIFILQIVLVSLWDYLNPWSGTRIPWGWVQIPGSAMSILVKRVSKFSSIKSSLLLLFIDCGVLITLAHCTICVMGILFTSEWHLPLVAYISFVYMVHMFEHCYEWGVTCCSSLEIRGSHQPIWSLEAMQSFLLLYDPRHMCNLIAPVKRFVRVCIHFVFSAHSSTGLLIEMACSLHSGPRLQS